MHLLNVLITLFVVALSVTARPLSVIDSYGGDLRPFFQLDDQSRVILKDSYPRWLGDEQAAAPWKSAVEQGTIPNTGIVRSYDFTITRAQIAPDGVERDMFAINGQFPGPLIEANWGDTVEVTVHNGIVDSSEPTSMHWHGLLQRDTPWADGAIGVRSTILCFTLTMLTLLSPGLTMPHRSEQFLHVSIPCRELRHFVLPFALQCSIYGGHLGPNSNLRAVRARLRHRRWTGHAHGLGE